MHRVRSARTGISARQDSARPGTAVTTRRSMDGTSDRESRLVGGRDVVVDADCGQPSVVIAFVHADSCLRHDRVPTPTNAVVLHDAAHAVIGDNAVLEADTPAAELLCEERPKLGRAAVERVRADGLAVIT